MNGFWSGSTRIDHGECNTFLLMCVCVCVCMFFECSNLNIFVIRSILCSVHNIINCYVTGPGAYIIYLPHPNSFTLRGISESKFSSGSFTRFLRCLIKNSYD